MLPKIERDWSARGSDRKRFTPDSGRIFLMVWAAFLLPIFHPSPLRAQSEQEQITALREEVNQLRQELDALKADVRQNRAQGARVEPSASAYQAAPARQQAAGMQTETQATTEASQPSEAESSAADVVPMLQSE